MPDEIVITRFDVTEWEALYVYEILPNAGFVFKSAILGKISI